MVPGSGFSPMVEIGCFEETGEMPILVSALAKKLLAMTPNTSLLLVNIELISLVNQLLNFISEITGFFNLLFYWRAVHSSWREFALVFLAISRKSVGKFKSEIHRTSLWPRFKKIPVRPILC